MDDGGVVDVALHAGDHLLVEERLCLLRRLTPEAGDILNDHEAVLIGIIELQRLFGFDMDAGGVEAEGLHAQDLVFALLVRGEGEKALGVEGLVEGGIDVDWLAVEGKIASAVFTLDRADLADAEIGVDFVLFFSVFKGQRAFIEVRVVRRPEAGLFDLQYQLIILAFGLEAFKRGLEGIEFSVDGGFDGHVSRKRGADDEGLDVACGAFFEIHGLPDAADVAVALLTVGMGSGIVVKGVDLDDVFCILFPDVGDLALDGVVAAEVGHELFSVDGDLGFIVARADDEEKARHFRLIGDFLPVKASALSVLLHARKRRGPGEGHRDGLIVYRLVEGELPRAVEIQPILTSLIRRGIHIFQHFHGFLLPFRKTQYDMAVSSIIHGLAADGNSFF